MSTTQRVVRKQLAGAEDLLQGVGVVTQTRGGGTYDIHKLDIPIPMTSVAEMQASSAEFVRVYWSDTTYTDYRRNPEGTTGISSTLGGTWEEVGNKLKSDINIVQKRFVCVADMVADTTLIVGQLVETIGYYDGWVATAAKPKGGNRYEIVSELTGTDDGGSFITLGNGLQAKGLFVDSYTPYQFGYIGDGVTDDTQHLQKWYNSAPSGSNLSFSDKSTAYLTSKLLFTKANSIDFCDSTLLLNNSSSPNNHHFDVYSTTETPETWTETLSLGSNTLTLASTLTAGDYVLVKLGDDPYDANEEHWVKVCRVINNTGSVITIDQMIPYNINGVSHSIAKISSLVSNCTFENVNIDYLDGSVPDTSIFTHSCFNVTFRNIHSIKSRILINPYDCHNMTFENISGYVLKVGVSSHGRLISGWQVEGATFDNLDGYNDDDMAMLFFESFCRHIKIRNIKINNSSPTATLPQIFITGGSYGIDIDEYSYNSKNNQPVVDVGGGVGEYSISNLRLSSYPKALNLSKVKSFSDISKSKDFINQLTCFQKIEVSMQPSLMDSKRRFCSGVVKNLWVYVADKTNLTGLYVMNSNNQGANVVSSLISGQWVKLSSAIFGGYGSDYPFNDPSYPPKLVSLYTNASMAAGTKLAVVAEYWPIVDGTAYTFPIETDV